MFDPSVSSFNKAHAAIGNPLRCIVLMGLLMLLPIRYRINLDLVLNDS